MTTESLEVSNKLEPTSTRSHPIKPLTGRSDYPHWRIRVKALLISSGCWNEKENKPIEKCHVQLIPFLSDDCLEHIMKFDSMDAKEIWNYFEELYLKSDLTSKVNCLFELLNFSYNQFDMVTSKVKIETLSRLLLHEFNQKESISIKELVALVALVRIPDEYSNLRTTIQETKSTVPSIDELFGSLIREEKSPVPLASYSHTKPSPSANTLCKCRKPRPIEKCWTCTPSSRPDCSSCKANGITDLKHKTNSKVCKLLQKMATFESKSMDTASYAMFDSGASSHFINNKKNIDIYSSEPTTIQLANGTYTSSSGHGKISLNGIDFGPGHYCPSFPNSLLSVSRIVDDGYDVVFRKDGVFISKGATLGSVFHSGHRSGSGFYLKSITEDSSVSLENAFLTLSMDELHRRLNHINFETLKKGLNNGTFGSIEIDSKSHSSCTNCLIGKMKHGSVPKYSLFTACRVGELVHTDICGPFNPAGTSGAIYYISFTDHYSKFTHIFLLKSKSDAFLKFKHYNSLIFNQTGRWVTFLRSDNGGEYKNRKFAAYCSEHGIFQQFTVPYHPAQNGVAERLNQTLVSTVRTLLSASNLQKHYWDEALLSAVFTKNLLPQKDHEFKSSYEIFHKREPQLPLLKPFGATCFYRIHDTVRKNKLNQKGQQAQFFSLSTESKSYRLLSNSKIVVAAYEDVYFDDSLPADKPSKSLYGNSSDIIFDIVSSDLVSKAVSNSQSTSMDPIEKQSLDTGTNDIHSATSFETASETLDTNDSLPGIDQTQIPPIVTLKDRRIGSYQYQSRDEKPTKDITAGPKNSKRISKKIDRAYFSSSLDLKEFLFLDSHIINSVLGFEWFRLPPEFCNTAVSEPLKYEDIEKYADSEKWYKAADDEIKSLAEHGTWSLVPLPADRDPIKCKWVFRYKYDSDGNIIKYKARLCACGYSQKYGIDYKEIYSPVVRAERLRLFLSIIASRDMPCHQMDVISAFVI